MPDKRSNLGPGSEARFNAISRRLEQITGKTEQSKKNAMLHLRPAIGKKLQRQIMSKKGAP